MVQMDFKNPYWTVTTRIQTLQRWILVHSFIYYDLNSSIVPDHMFDDNSRQLAYFKKKRPLDWKRAKYSYAMKDFDGGTGYGFVDKLNYEDRLLIERDAYYIKERFPNGEWRPLNGK
jgi:hypothetical protein